MRPPTVVPRRTDESGFSFVELLVVIVVLGVIGGIVAASTIEGFAVSRRAQERVQALADLQMSLERVGREIRFADRLYVDPTDYPDWLGALVERDGKTICYVYRLGTPNANGERPLVEDRETFAGLGADPATDSGTLQAGTFTERVGNDLTSPPTPLFRYFEHDGDEITDPGDLLRTAQVEITLLRELSEGRDPVVVNTRVNVRATRESDDTVAHTTC